MPKRPGSRGIRLDSMPEIPEREMNVIKARVKKLYYEWRQEFTENAMSEEDILQNILLSVYENFTKIKHKKFKSEDEIWKTMHYYVNWAIRKMARNVKRKYYVFKCSKKKRKLIQKRFDSRNVEELNDYCLSRNNLIVQPESESFEMLLHGKCTDEEYNLLHMKIMEDKTFNEIGKELKVSRQRVEQIYSKLVIKMRDRLADLVEGE